MPYRHKSSRKGQTRRGPKWAPRPVNWPSSRTETELALAHRKKYSGVKYFTETYRASDLLSGGVTAYGGKFTVRIADLPNYGGLRVLFDKFCITDYDVIIYPTQEFVTTDPTGTATSPLFPRMTYCVNRDGASPVPVNETSVLGEDNCKRVNLSGVEPIIIPVRNCRPWMGVVASAGGTSQIATMDSVATQKNWFDLNEASGTLNMLHYGVNYWIQSSVAPAGTPLAQVYIRAYYMCKEQQ